MVSWWIVAVLPSVYLYSFLSSNRVPYSSTVLFHGPFYWHLHINSILWHPKLEIEFSTGVPGNKTGWAVMWYLTVDTESNNKNKLCLKGKGIHDYAYSSNFTFPLARCVPTQPATMILWSFIQPRICAPGAHRAGWPKAVRNLKFIRHFYIWQALGIKPHSFWSWVQCPIHLVTCSHLMTYP